uniref:BACK domain-containing protein n=1 Tax=Strongyloides papillosus TaxID=174720 RepID=A0A0N5CI58_STREA
MLSILTNSRMEISFENFSEWISKDCMDNDYEEYYDKLISKYKCLDNIAISEIFGEAFTTPLWDFYTLNYDGTEVTKKHFLERTPYLFLDTPDIYVEIFKGPRTFLNACFFSAGVKIEDNDEEIIDDIVAKMNFYKDTSESILLWIKQNSPKICDSLRNFIISRITDRQMDYYSSIKSKVLTPVQVFLIKSSLNIFLNSNNFLIERENKKNDWYVLDNLTLTNITIDCLKKWAFNYEMSFVFIIKMVDDSISVFSISKYNNNEMEKNYNNIYLTILNVKPKYYKIIDNEIVDVNSLEKIFENYLKIKHDFSNVSDVEVWTNKRKNDINELYSDIDEKVVKKRSFSKRLQDKLSDEIVISIAGRCGKMTRRISSSECD